MKNRFFYIIALIPLLLFWGCLNVRPVAISAEKQGADIELTQFASLLSGRFSNQAQATADSAYLSARMVMTPIWPDRTDGKWLYVEQALASDVDKPYRQRVYRLTRPSPTIFQIDTYTIADAQKYAGLQNDSIKMQQLTYDEIEMKDGCTVTLEFSMGIYRGGTQGKDCPSELRGATYATSEFLLEGSMFYSWDRGFDAHGQQVWGPKNGGYIFIKQKP